MTTFDLANRRWFAWEKFVFFNLAILPNLNWGFHNFKFNQHANQRLGPSFHCLPAISSSKGISGTGFFKGSQFESRQPIHCIASTMRPQTIFLILSFIVLVSANQICNGYAELCNRSYGVTFRNKVILTLECYFHWCS